METKSERVSRGTRTEPRPRLIFIGTLLLEGTQRKRKEKKGEKYKFNMNIRVCIRKIEMWRMGIGSVGASKYGEDRSFWKGGGLER